MVSEQLLVLVCIPPGVRIALGEEQVGRLVSAHPRAEVVITSDTDRFADLLPRADAVLIWPAMAPLADARPPSGKPTAVDP